MSGDFDERTLRELFAQASDLVQCADPGSRLRYVNAAWSVTLGFPPDFAPGRSIYEFLAQESRAEYRALARKAVDGGQSCEASLTFVTASGAHIRTEGVLAAVASGEAAGSISALLRDTSGRQGIEKLRQEFLSRLSHELRTPLTSLLGSLALLRTERISGDREQRLELFEIAQRNGERLLGLIDELLELRRRAGELDRGSPDFRSTGSAFLP